MPFTVYLGEIEDLEWDESTGDFKIGPERYSYEKPYLGDAKGAASLTGEKKTGLLGRLLGRGVPDYLRLTKDDRALLAAFLPALSAAGVARCTLTYDGGNDEGFAVLEACKAADGAQIAPDSLAQNARFMAEVEPYIRAQQEAGHQAIFRPQGPPPELNDLVADYITYELPVVLISLLLGRGYGTGEYMLYGRAELDLGAQTITDDPSAPYPHGTPL